jgi:glycosyltransferase involved in cell wall biosynthesis
MRPPLVKCPAQHAGTGPLVQPEALFFATKIECDGQPAGTEMMKRLKVLVSAYACEPDKGSEPAVGWNWVKQIARFHDVWVITRANNRTAIARTLATEPIPSAHWIYLDLPRWAGFWKKGQRGLYPYYYLWQIGAFLTGRSLCRKIGFDLTHHLTFGIDWIPSFLAFLPAPFVWGPIIGAQSANAAFRQTFPLRAQAQELIRRWVRQSGRHDPVLQLAARKTVLGVASSPEAAKHLEHLGCKKVTMHPSVGMSSREIEVLSSVQASRGNTTLRFLSIGRLLAFKGLHLALRAFAEVQRRFPQAEWWVIGDGPERNRLRALAAELRIQGKVNFWGSMARQNVLERLSECDILVYPCLRGAISMACLEAMAAGRPVICLDLGGAALQVTEETGLKVPAISPEQVVNDLAQAMGRLAHDSALRARMGEAARKRAVEHFNWDQQGEWIRMIYQEVLTPCS